MVNLITTDSYFNIFPLLIEKLKEKGQGLRGGNLVFLEEKVSLMAERLICQAFGGSFNTDVYSFGNYLRVKKPFDNLLTKEGSSMALKRILQTTTLVSFKANKINLAPTLYELIMQLKSAKLTPEDILSASEKTDGILKNKLKDVGEIFSGYEKFIKENGFEDQSSSLSYLPGIIESSEQIPSKDVYIVGFGAFTAQMREAIKKLIEKASSVTAILVEGDNPLVFVNETAQFIRKYCRENSVPMLEKAVESDYTAEGKSIIDNIFNPTSKKKENGLIGGANKIYYHAATNPHEEMIRIAEVIL